MTQGFILNAINLFIRFIYPNSYFENINYLKEFYKSIKNKSGETSSAHKWLIVMEITFLL